LLILEKTKPHLILLDLMMPHMNGFEVCSAIREQYNRFELPVLMLTASHQINDVVKAINIGANDYLYKPYHDIEMLARVHNLISASESQKNSDENQQLKIEVQRRKQTQKKLRQANQRLTNILNSASEAVLLLNNHYQIIYSNQAAKYLLDDDITRLKGLTIDHVISTTFYHELSSIPFVELNTSKHMLAASHQDSSGATQELNIFTSSFELKGNTYINLFIQPKNNPADKQSADHILQTFSHELISNRNKITALEKVIHEIAKNGSIISVNSETTLKPLDRASSGQDPRSFLVSALRLTIDLWEKYTNKSKIELAEESNIWRIYLDGSTAKTRTLDKYLSIKSLPKNPRWRPVIRTANYIKLNCPLSSKEDEQLTELIQQIEYEYLEIGPNSE
ncbi:MAG: response regulator, partial [Oleispira sp.]|nr:response regulator [Oleispira sp.]